MQGLSVKGSRAVMGSDKVGRDLGFKEHDQ